MTSLQCLSPPQARRWVYLICAAFGMAIAPAHRAMAQAAAPRLVHRYLEVRLSPDATYVASVEGDSPTGGFYPDVRDLVIRRTDGSAEARVALPCGRVPQCWPGSLAWTRDSTFVNFTVRTPGSHAYGLYRVGADGGGLTKQLDFNGTLSDLKYSRDGTLALLAVENARKEVGATEAGAAVAGDLDAAPTEQRIAIFSRGALHWASPADMFVYEYDWRVGAPGFVGTAAHGDGDNNWWVAKLYGFAQSDGAATLIYSPSSIRQQITFPRVSPDGRTVAFIAGIMSDFGSVGGDIYSIPVEGGKALNLTPAIKASATSLAWGCGGSLRAQLLVSDQNQIVDLGAGTAVVTTPSVLWKGTETLNDEASGGLWACPAAKLASVRESYSTPPEIVMGAPGEANGELRELTHVNRGLGASFKAVSVKWKHEGFDEQGWLVLPLNVSGNVPMVTIVHGGPAAAAQPFFYGPGLQQAMLERGWAVFRPNPRGSFGQGERYAAANVRDLGHGDLRDILAGIDAAKLIAPIDENRLALTGGSYGGFMTMWAVTQTQRFKVAIAVAGISNWQSYYGQNGIDAWMLPYFGASVYDDPAVYARSSAINFIRNVRTPTFSYVGERDIECPAPQTEEFWHALKTLGVPTAIMIYPGEGHGLRDPANTQDALQRSLAWFDKYLK
jgi:dipeptidyl aminopeptidase/acylaminoacyl peptidase